jgi:hypothetical protein
VDAPKWSREEGEKPEGKVKLGPKGETERGAEAKEL